MLGTSPAAPARPMPQKPLPPVTTQAAIIGDTVVSLPQQLPARPTPPPNIPPVPAVGTGMAAGAMMYDQAGYPLHPSASGYYASQHMSDMSSGAAAYYPDTAQYVNVYHVPGPQFYPDEGAMATMAGAAAAGGGYMYTAQESDGSSPDRPVTHSNVSLQEIHQVYPPLRPDDAAAANNTNITPLQFPQAQVPQPRVP